MSIWSYNKTATPKQLTFTVCGLLTGAILIAVGAHLSYANIGPSQAKVQARKDFVKAHLRKLLQD